MSEEISYARRASGLVRGLSLSDAFSFGLMNQTPTFGFWTAISVGMVLFPRGNILIAAIISTVLCCIGYPLVWGILSASMPRAGAEYVYNSRILHPLVGTLGSAGNMSARFLGSSFATVFTFTVGLYMLSDVMSWDGIQTWLDTKWHVWLAATLLSAFGFVVVLFGIRVYSVVQKVFVSVGLLGAVVYLIVISLYSKGDFVTAWNELAAENDSLTYDQFIEAAGTAAGQAMPTSWNWFDTMGMIGVLGFAMIYAFFVAFLAGEVKRPDKNLLWANLLSVLVPGLLLVWFGAAIQHLADSSFIAAAGHQDYFGDVEGYALPFSPHFMGLASVVVDNQFVLGLIGIGFLAFWGWIVCINYLCISRIWFAWGMDRMGPRWFTQLSSRFSGTPVISYVAIFIGVEAVLISFLYLWYDTLVTVNWTTNDLVFVLMVTGVSALVFPYIAKVRPVWESSPYRTWRILGVPTVTVGVVVYFVYMVILLVWLVILPQNRNITMTSVYTYIIVFVGATAWYYYWNYRSRAAGIDRGVVYGQLPPE